MPTPPQAAFDSIDDIRVAVGLVLFDGDVVYSLAEAAWYFVIEADPAIGEDEPVVIRTSFPDLATFTVEVEDGPNTSFVPGIITGGGTFIHDPGCGRVSTVNSLSTPTWVDTDTETAITPMSNTNADNALDSSTTYAGQIELGPDFT